MKKYFLILSTLTGLSCNSQQNNVNEVLILSFIEDLGQDFTTEDLIKSHFYFSAIKSDEDLKKEVFTIYDQIFVELTKTLKSKANTRAIKIIKYNEDIPNPKYGKYKSVKSSELIYLVLLDDDLWFPVLIKDDKMTSLLRLVKNKNDEYSNFVRF